MWHSPGGWVVLFQHNEDVPIMWDNSEHTLECKNIEFALQQHDEEIQEEQFSPSFGLHLLPGLYSMPKGVVPKPHSSGPHLVTDYSAGDYALNSFIAFSDASIKLDNLQDFGSILWAVITEHGHSHTWLFKSNVAATYRCIPMHLLGRSNKLIPFRAYATLTRTWPLEPTQLQKFGVLYLHW